MVALLSKAGLTKATHIMPSLTTTQMTYLTLALSMAMLTELAS
jgi:hypothetical protein